MCEKLFKKIYVSTVHRNNISPTIKHIKRFVVYLKIQLYCVIFFRKLNVSKLKFYRFLVSIRLKFN